MTASPSAPPSGASPISRHAIVVLVLLTFIWGVNWPAMKLAVSGLPLWQFRAASAVFAIAALFTIARMQGHRLMPPPGHWGALAAGSMLNIVGWQVFSALSLQHIGSGRAAIIAYTMPMMTAALSVPLLGERLTSRIVIALVLGMGGMAFLLPPDLIMMHGGETLGIGLMLMAALCWGLGTIFLKRMKLPMPTTVITAWFFVFAFPPLAIAGMFETVPDFASVSWPVLLGALYTGTLPVAYGYWAWFRLVEVMPATIASIASLATPVVGVIAGAVVLGEEIGWHEGASLGLVVSSLVLVLYRKTPAKE